MRRERAMKLAARPRVCPFCQQRPWAHRQRDTTWFQSWTHRKEQPLAAWAGALWVQVHQAPGDGSHRPGPSTFPVLGMKATLSSLGECFRCSNPLSQCALLPGGKRDLQVPGGALRVNLLPAPPRLSPGALWELWGP